MENILTTLTRSLGWQGGTIHQVERAVDNSPISNESAYTYGLRRVAQSFDGYSLVNYSVPAESWDNDPGCNISYAKGLLVGLSLHSHFNKGE